MMRTAARTVGALVVAALAASVARAALHGDYLIDSAALRQDITRQETVYRILKSEAESGIVEQKGQATRAWIQAKQEDTAGKTIDVANVYAPIREAQLDLGYRNLESISLALLREAQRALANDDKIAAVAKADLAARLSPDQPAVRRAQAWIHLRSGSFLPAIRHAVLSVGLFATYLWASIPFLVNLGYRLAFAAALLVVAVAVTMVIKVFPLLAREIEGVLFEGPIGRLIGGALWLGILSLPLFLGFGLLWSSVIACAMVYRFCSREERRVLTVLAGLLVAIPLLLHVVAIPFGALADEGVEAMLKVRHGAFTRSDIGYLQQISRERPGDPWPRIALGLGHKKRGEYRDAEKEYRELLDQPLPTWLQAKVRVNLGNVHYARNELDKAVEEYRAAVSADEGLASAHYNLSHVYKQQLRLDEGDREFSKARELNEALITEFAGNGTPNPNRAVIDEIITFRGALGVVAGHGGPETDKVRAELVGIFLPGLLLSWAPSLSWAQGVLAVVLAALVIFLLSFLPAISRCAKCGRVSHPDTEEEKSGLCSQCRSVFQERDGVGAKARLTKMVEVRNYQRMQQRISGVISLVLPGMGHLHAGKGPVIGPVIFLVFSFGVLAALEMGRLVPVLHFPLYLGRSPILTLVFLAVVYLGAQVNFRR